LLIAAAGTLEAEWPQGWQQHWTWQQLAATNGHCTFKTGLPQGGKALMQLGHYIQYMQQQADEDPLYIFDEDFAAAAPGMTQWYQAPSWLPGDLLECAGASECAHEKPTVPCALLLFRREQSG
jgi:hypothetical protein